MGLQILQQSSKILIVKLCGDRNIVTIQNFLQSVNFHFGKMNFNNKKKINRWTSNFYDLCDSKKFLSTQNR